MDYMPRKRYDDEFKRNTIELIEATGRSMAEVAVELGIPYKTLENWKAKFRRRGGQPAKTDSPALAQPELAELKELRRKLAHTERERDILKKALAICSREEKNPGGSS